MRGKHFSKSYHKIIDLYFMDSAIVPKNKGLYGQIRFQPHSGRLGLTFGLELPYLYAVSPSIRKVHHLNPSSRVDPLGPLQECRCI